LTLNEGYFSRRTWGDWLFAAAGGGGAVFAFQRYHGAMDVYEKWPSWPAPCRCRSGWAGSGGRCAHLMLVVAALSLLAIGPTRAALARADTVFWLKYFLSSQSAILWMSVLFFMSTVFYWIGMFSRGQAATRNWRARRKLAWVAVTHGAGRHHGALVRKPPDRPDIGHIPVSNLYEVFVLFCWMTALFYLYYEQQYQTRAWAPS
jgi:hypothetical protein